MQSLNEENTLRYLSFVTYFATDFESFLRKFQSMKPLVHILYDEMERLLWNILSNFIKSKHLSKEKVANHGVTKPI